MVPLIIRSSRGLSRAFCELDRIGASNANHCAYSTRLDDPLCSFWETFRDDRMSCVKVAHGVSNNHTFVPVYRMCGIPTSFVRHFHVYPSKSHEEVPSYAARVCQCHVCFSASHPRTLLQSQRETSALEMR